MSEVITSRPYSTAAACEKCVFGSGQHASWCETAVILDYLKGKFDEGIRQFYEEIPFGCVVEAKSPPTPMPLNLEKPQPIAR